ncbi:MAG: FecR family protein, partial [Candidatus Omnitrophica bacterium]|nr:FecR family protein [Candidatus Omnitrophota bacterium]
MKKMIMLAAVMSFVMLGGVNAFCDAVGSCTYIEGRVDKAGPGLDGYFPCALGDKLSAGDAVRTKSFSKAEIAFADGSIVRLGPNTQVRINEYDIDLLGIRKKASIIVERGRIRAVVAKTANQAPFDIATPNSAGSVKGSDIYVGYEKSATSIMVQEGMFTALNPAFPDTVIQVPRGKQAVVPYDAAPQGPRDFLPVEKSAYDISTGPSIHTMKTTIRNAETTQAVVMRLRGAVRVQPSGSNDWHMPVIHEVLEIGDKVETGEKGRILIALSNGHIVELRENTQFLIRTLSRDPKTGDYENLFESDRGTIRAKLLKITGKSSFKIKTPTAVCGVRGTIMYLVIKPDITKAFFEGGRGFLFNPVSGDTRDIDPGMSSSSDGNGNISDPTGTSDDERQGFGSDWESDSQDDEYGYSDPGGNTGGDLGGGDTGGDLGGGDTGTEGGTDLFDEVPQEDNGNSGAGEEPSITTGGSLEGNFIPGYYDPYYNYLNGEFSLTTAAGDWTGIAA